MNDNISADAAPPNLSIKKRRYLRWLVAAAILFLAWFCWQLFGPNPPIRISRETTYITEPLLPNGLPNFHAYVLEQLRAGVTPKNNAAVLLWEVFGPKDGKHGMTPEEWQVLCKELQITPAKQADDYLGKLYSNQRAVAAWMHEQGRLQLHYGKPSDDAVAEVLQMSWPFKLPESSDLLDAVQNEIDATTEAPWNSERLPPLAAWLKQHDAQLSVLAEASKRPRLFSPDASLFTQPDAEIMSYWSSDIFWKTSELAYILPSRAMWHLGEGRHRDAWENILAVLRWSRLIGQDPTLARKLNAPALDGIALESVLVLLQDKKLTPELARQIADDLASLKPVTQFGDAFNGMERIYFIHLFLTVRQQGAGTILSYFDQENETASRLLNYVTFDWNVVLAEANHWYDRVFAAFNLPCHDDRVRELTALESELQTLADRLHSPSAWLHGALNRRIRSEILAAALVSKFKLSTPMLLSIEDRAASHLQLTQLAAALAVYRADHGQYPERLEQLVPEVISILPVDLYHAKPFIYQREPDGYLLYCVGENGIDDGGSNSIYGGGILAGREVGWDEDPATQKLRQQIPAGADDLSIRVPRPPFKLPAPPTAQ